MPLYDYLCQSHGKTSLFRHIEGRDDPAACGTCQAPLQRVLAAPMLRPEIQPYQSPVNGKWVDSRAARREDLKRTGSIDWHPEIAREVEHNRQSAIEANFKAVDATIEKTVTEMHASGLL